MNRLFKFLSLLFPICLIGCDPITEPSLTNSNTEPTIVNENIDLLSIKASGVSRTKAEHGIEDDIFEKYHSEKYNVDNVLLINYDEYFILEYELEFSNQQIPDTLTITLDKPNYWLYTRHNNKSIRVGQTINFVPDNMNGKVYFYIFNYDRTIGGGPYCNQKTNFLVMQLHEIEVNNKTVNFSTEDNNKFTTYFCGEYDVGYDVIKNTDKEVIIDFSKYKYKENLVIESGIQTDNYSYLFEENTIVNINFEYKNLVINRTIEVRLTNLIFSPDKEIFEENGNIKIMNIEIIETETPYMFTLLVDNSVCEFYSNTYSKGIYYSTDDDENFEKLFNRNFNECVYSGKDYLYDLTNIIKSSEIS